LLYASGRGLIHRDIKPSNILRTPTGEAKIIDLGLALQSQFEDERVTREGTTVGTVDYMAPEQARDSRATSTRSDMYSLGCTFYYLLAGVPPFPGGDITDKLTRHARAPAPDIRDLRPDVPPRVAGILLRMMSKQPEDRFADYDALIAALDSALVPEVDAGPAVALVPLEEGEEEKRPEAAVEPASARTGVGYPIDRDDDAILPLSAPRRDRDRFLRNPRRRCRGWAGRSWLINRVTLPTSRRGSWLPARLDRRRPGSSRRPSRASSSYSW
jgi:serine/threonine-protein kinase